MRVPRTFAVAVLAVAAILPSAAHADECTHVKINGEGPQICVVPEPVLCPGVVQPPLDVKVCVPQPTQ